MKIKKFFTPIFIIISIVLVFSCNKEEYPVEVTVKYSDGKVVPNSLVVLGANLDPNSTQNPPVNLFTDYSGKVSYTFKLPAILICTAEINNTDTVLIHKYGAANLKGTSQIRLVKNQTVYQDIKLQ